MVEPDEIPDTTSSGGVQSGDVPGLPGSATTVPATTPAGATTTVAGTTAPGVTITVAGATTTTLTGPTTTTARLPGVVTGPVASIPPFGPRVPLIFIPGAGRVLDLNPTEVAKLATGGRVDADVRGATGQAAAGVGTVLLDVTATSPTKTGRVLLTPVVSEPNRPAAVATVNFAAGATIKSRVAVPIGNNGAVRVESSDGLAGLAIDVVGWLTTPAPVGKTEPSAVSLDPCRVLDTAAGQGGLSGAVGPNTPFDLPFAGIFKVPAATAAAPPTGVLVGLGAANATEPLQILVVPSGQQSPALTVNVPAGAAGAGIFHVPLAGDTRTAFYVRSGAATLTVDVVGWMDKDSFARPSGPC